MADTKQIEVQALWDGTKFEAGTREAEASMEALADSVEASSEAIQDSLDRMDDGINSTLGTGGTFSKSVDDVEASGSRMSDVGGEVGAEFSENLSEGFQSGDFVGVALETFASLTAAIGPLGIGFGVGALIVNNMIQGAKDRRAAFVESVSSIFSELEIRAQTSANEIRNQIIKTFDFTSTVERVGGGVGVEGAFQTGMERIRLITDATGVSMSALIDYMQTGVDKTGTIEDALEAVDDDMKLLGSHVSLFNLGVTDTGKAARIVKEETQKIAAEQEAANQAGRDYKETLERAKDSQLNLTDAQARGAEYMRLQADAAERLEARLVNIVTRLLPDLDEVAGRSF